MMGLAFGSGHMLLGILGWGRAIVTLMGLPRLEALISNDWYGSVVVILELNDVADVEVRRRIESHGLTVKDIDIEYDMIKRQRTLRITIKFKRGQVLSASTRVIADLITIPGVREVKWA
jgi:uncharacterized membrane protein YhiD involved in acid resistance